MNFGIFNLVIEICGSGSGYEPMRYYKTCKNRLKLIETTK